MLAVWRACLPGRNAPPCVAQSQPCQLSPPAASWAGAQSKAAERTLRAIMAGEEQEEHGPRERLASGAGAAAAAAQELWADAARGAVAAALLRCAPQLLQPVAGGTLGGQRQGESQRCVASAKAVLAPVAPGVAARAS